MLLWQLHSMQSCKGTARTEVKSLCESCLLEDLAQDTVASHIAALNSTCYCHRHGSSRMSPYRHAILLTSLAEAPA